MNLISQHPMDGTFNQYAPLLRHKEGQPQFSLDLSAATDRLPILLQQLLLENLFKSNEFALNWGKLLVDRVYEFHPSEELVQQFGWKPSAHKYAVGQPMGALSS